MNLCLQELEKMARRKSRRIIGLMSGTSMDGLDIALCRFYGSGASTDFVVESFRSVPYTDRVREQLLAFARSATLNTELLCVWHTYLGVLHGRYVRQALRDWQVDPQEVDLVASHGQTLYHAPKHKHGMEEMPHATLQIGDGDHVAAQTGIITISDFRQRDTARGGEGAPLAAYGDYLLFSDPDRDRFLLNIGGIANFTFLGKDGGVFPPLSYDTGPGNTLIDAAVRRYFPDRTYDEGGQLADSGQVNEVMLERMLEHPYFHAPAPKTTGFEVFNLEWVDACLEYEDQAISPEDLIATLTCLTVESIAREIRSVCREHCLSARELFSGRTPASADVEVLVSGGGAHNKTLMRGLSQTLHPLPVRSLDETGVSADAKEALFFGALANELVCGSDSRLHLGKICFPDR